MSSIIVERELTEDTFGALVRYARQVFRIHVRGLFAELAGATGRTVP